MTGSFEVLLAAVSGFIRESGEGGARRDEARFDAIALRVFEYQREANGTYGRYVRARSVRDPSHWWEVPPVPARAFKHLVLRPDDHGPPEAVFRTSGTTGLDGRRGEHHVPSLGLYRLSAVTQARREIFSDQGAPPLLALVPSPADTPESSLSTMVGFFVEELSGGEGRYFVDAEGRIDLPGLREGLEDVERAGRDVFLVGTAFAFVHVLDALARDGLRFRLSGSRIMETGGFKGRSRVVERGELYRMMGERLGIGPERIVNEYGMTEMLSQFYDVLPPAKGRDVRRHRPAPWVRSRVLDPITLEPVGPGGVGVLSHFDLANVGSAAHILTEDLARAADDGFELLGRAHGAEARGCSLTMEHLLAART